MENPVHKVTPSISSCSRGSRRRPHPCFLAISALAILATAPSISHADQINLIWKGIAGNWEDPDLWNPAGIPDNSTLNTYIATVMGPGSTTLNSSVTVDLLRIDNGILEVTGGNSLAVLGNASSSLNSGTLSIHAGATVSAPNFRALTGGRLAGAGDFHFTGSDNLWTAP